MPPAYGGKISLEATPTAGKIAGEAMRTKAGEGAPVVFDRKAECDAKAAMRYNYVNFRSGPPPGNLHLAQRVHRLTR